ncbi:hypothetical protein PtB15_2B811 [Puccinia triticina]|nr:hypothetical protein PtB15_2B811 [Puccinia triticina]
MTTYNRVESWYTDSSYNADEHYENSPFATDPRTFPVRASLSSTAMSSQPYAMIPLPSQFQLYTIEEKRNLEEDVEPCSAVKKRYAESLAVKNGDLIEKSLKSISLIRSRLLQQQESNRKKTSEFQQIRSSIGIVHSLVHLVHDNRCNKTWIEFSTEDYKILSNMKNLKLSKVEKERTPSPNDGGESLSIDEVEPKTPTRVSVASSIARSDSSFGPVRSYKAMSITANVPTTPTKPTATPTSEIYNLYHSQSSEDLSTVADLTSLEQIASVYHHPKPSPQQTQESYYKTQLSKFNLEKSAAISNDHTTQADCKNSPGNFSTTSVAVTLTTAHDHDEWDQHDDMVHTTESASNDERSENSSLRKLSIGPNQSRMMAIKLKQFTRGERNNLIYPS